jgi:hypothetical protein
MIVAHSDGASIPTTLSSLIIYFTRIFSENKSFESIFSSGSDNDNNKKDNNKKGNKEK